jgi:hypothetical protein
LSQSINNRRPCDARAQRLVKPVQPVARQLAGHDHVRQQSESFIPCPAEVVDSAPLLCKLQAVHLNATIVSGPTHCKDADASTCTNLQRQMRMPGRKLLWPGLLLC